MPEPHALTRVVNRIGDIANAVQAKIRFFVVVGLVASSALAWKAFSLESAIWWNVLKCGLLVLPVLIWLLVWFVLNQLRDAPNLVADLVREEDGVLASLSETGLSQRLLKEPEGLPGVFRTIREFRRQDGLELVFDTISGVTLITNPLFVILVFLSMAILSVLIIITPFVLLL